MDKELFKLIGGLAEDWTVEFPWLLKPNLEIIGFALFGSGQHGYLSFCDRVPDVSKLSPSDASVVLCKENIEPVLAGACPEMLLLSLRDPRSTFINLVHRIQTLGLIDVSDRIPRPLEVSPDALIADGTFIHPSARIDANVVIGANCVINAGTWIQEGAIVGDGTVIGSTGINAYRGNDNIVRRFPHLASVIIGKGTEIGSNVVVVRGILSSTVIGSANVIGNLSNIGHGVKTGDSVWMSAGCKIGGHVTVGDKATVGIGAVVRDNLAVGSDVQIGMGSVVVRDVTEKRSVFGNPAKTVPPIKAGPIR